MTDTTTASAARAGKVRRVDLTVTRLGFGAMRITGQGIWGRPPTATRPRPCYAAPWTSASRSSTPRMPTGPR